MSGNNDKSRFESALKWSQDRLENHNKDPGINWVLIIIVVIIILIASWWVWSAYGSKEKSGKKSTLDDLEKGATSTKTSYMIIDDNGHASK